MAPIEIFGGTVFSAKTSYSLSYFPPLLVRRKRRGRRWERNKDFLFADLAKNMNQIDIKRLVPIHCCVILAIHCISRACFPAVKTKCLVDWPLGVCARRKTAE